MIDVTLPSTLVMATLGIMLGFANARDRWTGVVIAVSIYIASAFVPTWRVGSVVVITACWVTIAAISVFVYLPRLQTHALVYTASAVAGLAAGIAQMPNGGGLGHVLPALGMLSIAPTLIAIRAGLAIAPRVVTSWILAVSLLAAILPFAVSHPGYVADHRE